MPLRRRVSIVAAAAVAVAVVIAAAVCYAVVRGQLHGQVDNALRAQAQAVREGNLRAALGAIPGIGPNAGGPAQYVQLYVPGRGVLQLTDVTLPVDARTRAAASGAGTAYLSDIDVGGSHLREITVPATLFDGQPVAVQLARPLGGIDHVLTELRLILLVLCAGGIALAAVLGRLAANRVLAPLAEVTQTAQVIGETDDLTRRLAVHADDEVGQLATRFNEMLERLALSRSELDASVQSQRQLVADASHELRTPITSLRTNIEVLLAEAELGAEDRRRLLADVVEQIEELSALISDLIELGRGDLPEGVTEDVRLDRIVEESLARARRNAPSITFAERLATVVVEGVPERLARAVNNLLDNAVRHSPAAGVVELEVDRGGLSIRDHGGGIAEHDLPYVFDRFYRGANSRGSQGSGLGLAIVRQVAEQHGGSVTAANAPDGGAIFTFRLPTSPASGPEPETERYDRGGLASRA